MVGLVPTISDASIRHSPLRKHKKATFCCLSPDLLHPPASIKQNHRIHLRNRQLQDACPTFRKANYIKPTMSAPVGAVPSTCCKRDGSGCVCAKEATCSCGKQKALHCTCEKAATENKIAGATCSCGQRAAGACTCNRSGEENTVTGDKCACGKRSSNSCTCAGAELGSSELETDFTTKK